MILITGCARSGTSLTAGILRACGLNEHTGVRDKIVKPYLTSIGADRMGQSRLPELEDLKPAPDWRARVTRAIGQPEPWGYKCAKACLIWPLWVEHFPDAKWVIVRRDKERIIDSCLRTHFMRAHKDRVGWGAWADGYIKRLEELKWEADCIEVWPDDAVKGDVEAYRPVVEFCGLDWNEDAVRAEINPRQWHG